MDALGRHPHVEGVLADQTLGEEARVRVGAEAHRVASHVLHTARDREVVRPEGDTGTEGGDTRHGARAHAVDGEAGHRFGQAGEQRCGAAEGETLIALLRGRGDRDIIDPVFGHAGVPLQQLDHGLDHQIVCARVPVLSFFAGPPERSANSVDEDDISSIGHNASQITSMTILRMAIGRKRIV